MASISETIDSRKIRPAKTRYKTIEILAVQTTIEREETLLLGLYKLPKATGKDFPSGLEEELNEIVTWAIKQSGCCHGGFESR